MKDTDLLSRYAHEGDEVAFRSFVSRYVDLVHSAALRQVNGDAHLAADVTQIVFTDVARKARALSGHQALAGWLFTSTRYAAAKLVRQEQRRRGRELKAQHDEELAMNDDLGLDWNRVRAVLDDALANLGTTDREAIILRYFQCLGFSEIGHRLNVSDNTARMRVERALEKVRAQLARRGVTSTSAALASAMTTHAVVAAPAGLGASVAGSALTVAAASAVSGASFMGMTLLQTGIASALTVAGAALVVVQAHSNDALRAELAAVRAQNVAKAANESSEHARLAKLAAEVADLRRDDVEFARMRDELAVLRSRLTAAAPAKPAGALVLTSSGDRLPVLKTMTKPVYPEALRRAGVSGNVIVDLIIDSKGDVQNAYAFTSSERGFEAPAVDAVRTSVFETGTKGGRPVNAHLRMSAQFDAVSGQTTLTIADPVSAAKPATWF